MDKPLHRTLQIKQHKQIASSSNCQDDRLAKQFCRDDNKRWIFIKYCVDYYYT